MNRTWLLTGAAVVATFLVTGPAGPATRAHGQALSAAQKKDITADVSALRPVTLAVAAQDFNGPLTQQSVHEQIQAVVKEFVRQGLDNQLKEFRPVPVVILREDPTGKPRVRMSIGLSLPGKIEMKRPLQLEQVEFAKSVRYLHRGPHEQLGDVYRSIEEGLKRANAKESAGWPVVLQILDDPTRFPKDQIRTVMNVPVK